MKIVHCDQEIIDNVPKILSLLYSIYGEDCTEVQLFATLDEDKLGFIARVDGNCVYINHQGDYSLFTVDESDNLVTIYKKPYTINFDDGPFLVDDKKVEHILDFNQMAYPDDEGYDGLVTYKQYDIDKDIMCEINFQQMYREDNNGVARVYSYHTKEIDTLFIDLDYEKRGFGKLNIGPLPRKSIYYGKIKFNSEEAGYRMMAIADYGLMEVLSKGPYELLREDNPVRYSRITRVKLNGEFGDNWPFGGQLKSSDIDELISSYGFSKNIPQLLLDIYNGNDGIISFYQELAQEMARVKAIYKEPDNTDLCMTLRLVPDSK